MDHIIEISHLTKSFGSIRAVQDVSFGVKRGELFAFLGLNGAGKSTTISILCGQLAKDGGTVRIGDCDIDVGTNDVKRMLGVVFQQSVLDKPLTVRENLRSRAALYGIMGKAFDQRLDELCSLLEIGELLDRTVGKLSGGQRRRIDVARALLHRPTILVLDEPTTGLDPQTRRLLWDAIDRLRRESSMTVFLTTHYMEEAAQADDVVILDSGKIVAQGSPLELKKAYTKDFICLYGASHAQLQSLGYPFEEIPGGYRITVPSTAHATTLIVANPSLFCDYEITKGNMDDVFLAVTGKSLSNQQTSDQKTSGGRAV